MAYYAYYCGNMNWMDMDMGAGLELDLLINRQQQGAYYLLQCLGIRQKVHLWKFSGFWQL